MSTQRNAKRQLRDLLTEFLAISILSLFTLAASAEDFGQGARRELLETQTSDLPQGTLRVGGGERVSPPGGRSPWHTSGPKILYVVEGTMNVEGLGGQIYLSCGPAPKLCLTPNKSPFFFYNPGPGPLKFVVIGIDAVNRPTIHEEVGTVAAIVGNQVTLAIGNLRSGDLVAPRREITLTVATIGSIAVGDDVLTTRLNKKSNTAENLVKLAKRWQ
mgnify:FL=1